MHSRLINIASQAGRTSAPGMSAYAASKHAVEAFSDSVRRELLPWNIKVSIVEPGVCVCVCVWMCVGGCAVRVCVCVTEEGAMACAFAHTCAHRPV